MQNLKVFESYLVVSVYRKAPLYDGILATPITLNESKAVAQPTIAATVKKFTTRIGPQRSCSRKVPRVTILSRVNLTSLRPTIAF
jgi:hypothetical protein